MTSSRRGLLDIATLILALTEQGSAILLVEQFVAKAPGYADHCYIMDHGQLAGAGQPDELQDSGIIHRVYLGGEPEARLLQQGRTSCPGSPASA